MDSSQFKKLVSSNKNKLFRMANWMLHNRHDAEDVVQEVFVKLWKMKDKLDDYSSPVSLAFRITRNLCLNRLNAKKPAISEVLLERLESHEALPDKSLEYQDDISLVKSIIIKLPEKQQLILQLKGIEGLETNEIAALLEENENNVRVLLSRARRKMKDAYDKYFIEHEK